MTDSFNKACTDAAERYATDNHRVSFADTADEKAFTAGAHWGYERGCVQSDKDVLEAADKVREARAKQNEAIELCSKMESDRNGACAEIELLKQAARPYVHEKLVEANAEIVGLREINSIQKTFLQAAEKNDINTRAMCHKLADALMSGEPDYNSAWSMICLMAEGEGSDARVYQVMAKAIHKKLKPLLDEYAQFKRESGGGE